MLLPHLGFWRGRQRDAPATGLSSPVIDVDIARDGDCWLATRKSDGAILLREDMPLGDFLARLFHIERARFQHAREMPN